MYEKCYLFISQKYLNSLKCRYLTTFERYSRQFLKKKIFEKNLYTTYGYLIEVKSVTNDLIGTY